MKNTEKEGKLIIVSAPSGAGKSTIVRSLLKSGIQLQFSISACNRPPRGREVHGVEYYFLSTEDFLQKVKENAFLEWEEVYPGRYYGTLREEVERILDAGANVIFDVDVVGGLNIKKEYGEQALALYILPPSIDALELRLRKRSTESDEEIRTRLGKARQELEYAKDFDVQIINTELDAAIRQTIESVRGFLDEKPS